MRSIRSAYSTPAAWSQEAEPMQTNFTLAQLANPDTNESEKILRACVHCGFCTATCPTYVLLGDELDSPRGRIYLIKDMLENDRPANDRVVRHVDRCLSCLSCMTTCPSGVHYMHLIDHARAHVEATYTRPVGQRLLRALIAFTLPRPKRFRVALLGASLARPFAGLLPKQLRAMLRVMPQRIPGPSPVDRPQTFAAQGVRRKRVALLSGCVQQALDTDINEATIRLLTRLGCEVVVAKGAGCCGGLVHHMGKTDMALPQARRTIDAWVREADAGGLDAVVINTSGCGTTLKDYGFMFRDDPAYAAKAARISALSRDVTELVAELGLETAQAPETLIVAYHSACSLQHGQKITALPKQLLMQAGFAVCDVPEAHLCCGSAGTYNLLQPSLAGQLAARKIRNVESTHPDIVAAGNIGCMLQIGQGTEIPVVHTVELLDWATGGPKPAKLTA
jgi:glycolate oxidase iron-sulfur subunit